MCDRRFQHLHGPRYEELPYLVERELSIDDGLDDSSAILGLQRGNAATLHERRSRDASLTRLMGQPEPATARVNLQHRHERGHDRVDTVGETSAVENSGVDPGTGMSQSALDGVTQVGCGEL